MKTCILYLTILSIILGQTAAAAGLTKRSHEVEIEEIEETAFETGWSAGYESCFGTCAKYVGSSEENNGGSRSSPAQDSSKDVRKKRQAESSEEAVQDEDVEYEEYEEAVSLAAKLINAENSLLSL